MSATAVLQAADIKVGDEITPLDIDVTTTAIVSGALATHDWMPMHHDRDFAQAQGAPDIFFNIFSTNAYVGRFVSEWAGPEAVLKNIKIRLGVQAVPGHVMQMRGTVTGKETVGDECLIQVDITAAVATGNHAMGSVAFTLPMIQ